MSQLLHNQIKARAISIYLAALGLLTVVASFHPEWRIWGLDYAAFLPVWFRVVLVISLIIWTVPAISERSGRHLTRKFKQASDHTATMIYIFIGAILVGLFLLLSTRNHLLGDGFVIQSTIVQGRVFSPTEPLDYFIHHLLFRFLGGSEKAAYLSYAVTSYAAGVAFLGIIYIYTKRKDALLIVLPVALTFGIMQLFFGYVESYAIAFVFTVLYFFSGWRDLERGAVSQVTVLALALAIGLHLSSLVFLPSLFYLLMRRFQVGRTAVFSAATIGMICILAALYLSTFTDLVLWEIFVPLMWKSYNPYHLLSPNHLADLLNIILLDFPLLLIIPFILSMRRDKPTWFFLSGLLPALAYMVMIDPRIGAPRDWDLLSLLSAPLLVFIAVSLSYREKSENVTKYSLVIPLFLFALLHTGGWIYHNTDKWGSYRRMKNLIRSDIHYSQSYFQGYRNKSWSVLAQDKYLDGAETIRACRMRYDACPEDTPNAIQLARCYFAAGDTVRALKMLRTHWDEVKKTTDAIPTVGSLMMSSENYSEAEEIYQVYIDSGYAEGTVFHNLGVCKEIKGDKDIAFRLYNKALQMWPSAPPEYELGIYLKYLRGGYPEQALSGFKRLFIKLSDEGKPIAREIISALEAGNESRADSLAVELTKILGGIGERAGKNTPLAR